MRGIISLCGWKSTNFCTFSSLIVWPEKPGRQYMLSQTPDKPKSTPSVNMLLIWADLFNQCLKIRTMRDQRTFHHRWRVDRWGRARAIGKVQQYGKVEISSFDWCDISERRFGRPIIFLRKERICPAKPRQRQ
jgi:hypothetical protein